MKTFARKIIVQLLLSTYLAVGVIGHLTVLTFFDWGTNPHQLNKSESSKPPTGTEQVYWTQYKHVPATIKNSVDSPAAIIQPTFHRLISYHIFLNASIASDCLGGVFTLYSSRAPPQL